MTVVECIKDDWTINEKTALFIELGEPTPKIGEQYVIDEYVHLDDVSDFKHLVDLGIDKYEGYILKEFDWREMGMKISWNKENFKIVKETFTPNHIHDGSLVETFKMTCSFNFDLKNK